MSESELEQAYQRIIKDSKLGEFLWPAIKDRLESEEIQAKNGELTYSPQEE